MNIKTLEYMESKTQKSREFLQQIQEYKNDVDIMRHTRITEIIIVSEISRDVRIHDDGTIIGILEDIVKKLEGKIELLEKRFAEL